MSPINVARQTPSSRLAIRSLLAGLITTTLVVLTVQPAQADPDVLTPVAAYTAPSGDYGVHLDRHSSTGGLQVTAWNDSGTAQDFGMGATLDSSGDVDMLWQDGYGGFSDLFADTVQSGDTYSQDIPDWTGVQYVFYSNIGTTPAEFGRYQVPGKFLPIQLNGNATDGLTSVQVGYGSVSVDSPATPGSTIDIDALGQPQQNTNAYLVPAADVTSGFNSTNLVVSPNVRPGLTSFDNVNAIPVAGDLSSAGTGSIDSQITLPANLAPGQYYVYLGNKTTNTYTAGPYDITAGPQLTVTEPGATPSGTNVAVTPQDQNGNSQVGFAFSNVTNPGTTTVTASQTGPTPTGFSTLTGDVAYYDLETTATFTGAVTVCIDFNTSTMTEAQASSQHLYHYTNNAWVDITTSASAGEVCGTTTSFSPFAVGTPLPTVTKFAFLPPVKTKGNTTALAGLPYIVSFKAKKGITLAAKYPQSQQVNCTTGAAIGAASQTGTWRGWSLVYLPKTGTYSYVWLTDKKWRNTCRQFTMQLKDGSVGTAVFQFR